MSCSGVAWAQAPEAEAEAVQAEAVQAPAPQPPPAPLPPLQPVSPLVASFGASLGYGAIAWPSALDSTRNDSSSGVSAALYGRLGVRFDNRIALAWEPAVLATATPGGAVTFGQQMLTIEAPLYGLILAAGGGVSFGWSSVARPENGTGLGPAIVIRATLPVPEPGKSTFWQPALELRGAVVDQTSAMLLGISLAWGK